MFSPADAADPDASPDAGTQPPAGGDGQQPGGDGQPTRDPALPEWISDKYRSAPNPVEAQAKAYAEAQKALSTKTEELKATVRQEVLAEAGIPEGPDGYELPDDFAKDHPLAGPILDEMHKAGLGQKQVEAVLDMYRRATSVDVEAEKAKLGDDADQRLAQVNAWLSRAAPRDMDKAIGSIMRTAEGVQLMEKLMGAALNGNPLPNGDGVETSEAASREGLRSMMMDPRYAQRDPAWLRQIEAYAARIRSGG